jgi:hypothetical protein
MTASVANGFGQILYEPNATTCHERPFAFHPMYSSAVDRGTTWSAHTSNVAFSDEIGHFELCNAADPATLACTSPGAGDKRLDDDDQLCLSGADFGALVPLTACVLDDGDFDGPSYQRDWPGTLGNVARDAALHPTPVRFTVPTSNGQPLERTSFETDLPRIERGEPANPPNQCDGLTGRHCVNPPPGSKFYPFYTATRAGGQCMLQQGGRNIPGTFDDFGGSSRAEYGNLLFVLFPDVGFQPVTLAEDFHRDLGGNPCAGG